MSDNETLAAYAEHAKDYATRFASSGIDRHLKAFIEALPDDAYVLDLGCGPGQAAASMVASGLRVDAWDASPEMAAAGAEKFGLPIRVATFDALEAIETYDGIYANFSLLHAPKSDMPANLNRIAAALKPGGLFHIGTKTGEGEIRDRLRRFYAYYQDAELTGLLDEVGLTVISRDFGAEEGLDGTVAPWIVMRAVKND